MKYNPVYFIAESYRAAILYHEWYFMDHWKLMLYNFGIVAIFFAIGAYLHMKYRDQFADFFVIYLYDETPLTINKWKWGSFCL